jgi:hypothetical protein
MFDIKIAAFAAKAVGWSQFLPAASGVNGAAKLLGINKGFHHQDRMAVALLPVGVEPVQHQTQGTPSRITPWTSAGTNHGEFFEIRVPDNLRDERFRPADYCEGLSGAHGARTEGGIALFAASVLSGGLWST